jgi:hypothetical protein
MVETVCMIGYSRVSKADGRQVHDLQFDALIAAGVEGRARSKRRTEAWTTDGSGCPGLKLP